MADDRWRASILLSVGAIEVQSLQATSQEKLEGL